MKRYIPVALTTLRLLLGPLALVCALERVNPVIYLPIAVSATLSDIFDGIVARRLGVSTIALRRYDSATDVIYYLFMLAALWIVRKPAMAANAGAIAVILVSEAAAIAVGLARFQKYPSTHSYLAKFYGLCLLATLIGLLVFGGSGWVVKALATVAVLTNAEIIAIHLLVNAPPVDVRSVLDVIRAAK